MPNTYSTRQEENQQNSCPGSCCTTCIGAYLQRARTELVARLHKRQALPRSPAHAAERLSNPLRNLKKQQGNLEA